MNIRTYSEIDYENRLNEKQYEIVKNADGPSIVIAGAGSGKTRVLVYRVCYLLERGISPSSIMLVTFTNKAANEMIERVKEVAGFYPKGLWAGTFHHIANILLRIYGKEINLPSNFTILDEEDSVDLIKEIVDKFHNKEEFPHPGKIKSFLSLSVNTVEPIRDIINTRFIEYSHLIHQIETISKEYAKRKRELNLLDYDDLLLFWYRLMKDEKTGRKISEKFIYIIVDEYHDTNKLQAQILYQVAKVHKNIMVVGDDAQSIYSFRGATVNNILEFPKIYPDAKIFYLDINYRSTPEILDFANDIISHNKNQFPKNLKSIRKSGVKPVVIRCYDIKEEAIFVSRRIYQLIKSGADPSEIAVLFRSRYQSAELEIELNKLKIPYIIRGGLRFFEQAHIKDILCFYKVIVNFKDEISWARIFSLTQGIGKKSSEKLIKVIRKSERIEDFERKMENIKISSKGLKNLKNNLKLIKKIKDIPIAKGINLILNSFYSDYLKKKYKDDIERKQDIESLKEIASNYNSLDDFLSEASLQEHTKGEIGKKGSYIVLSTVHQAKGLEWKFVFIIGVCNGHFPHISARDDIVALEEERRIFYVAVTRAKEDLYITYYIRDFYRNYYYNKSLFIEEISPFLYENWDFK